MEEILFAIDMEDLISWNELKVYTFVDRKKKYTYIKYTWTFFCENGRKFMCSATRISETDIVASQRMHVPDLVILTKGRVNPESGYP